MKFLYPVGLLALTISPQWFFLMASCFALVVLCLCWSLVALARCQNDYGGDLERGEAMLSELRQAVHRSPVQMSPCPKCRQMQIRPTGDDGESQVCLECERKAAL